MQKPPSKEEFDMLINEQGWKYAEKITFDMTKKTVVHQVPAHRHLNESNVMEDFVSVSVHCSIKINFYPLLKISIFNV